jgi:hypothetical protein
MPYIAVILVLFSITAPAAAETAQPGRYPPVGVSMTLTRVSEHVYFVQGEAGVATDNEGFISNAGIVVFDALGTPSLGKRLLEEVRKISDQPVVRVIVSHYHADHIYGLQVFEEQGAEIWAPRGAEKYLRSANALERLEERRFSLDPWVNETTRLVEPDRYIAERETFELGAVRFTLSPVGAAHSVLQRMEVQQLVALVPGHGALARDPNRAISTMRRYLSYLREKMGAAVEDFIPFDEAYAGTDWSEFEHLPAFVEANRRNAYQVYLSMEAESLTK